jgi:hypothetical protein
MTTARSWKLWAHRYPSGIFMHAGDKSFVEGHLMSDPVVPVLVEEVAGDLFDPRVTHYGWQYTPSQHMYSDGAAPCMIQIRASAEPSRALALLSMCFHYGVEVAVKNGDGTVIGLSITERKDD